MENDVHVKIYKEYLSAMKELADAQEKVKEYFPSISFYPVEEPPDLSAQDKEVFRRLNKAYREYAEKYKIWRISKKVNAL